MDIILGNRSYQDGKIFLWVSQSCKPFVSASITPALSKYLLNSSFFDSGCREKEFKTVWGGGGGVAGHNCHSFICSFLTFSCDIFTSQLLVYQYLSNDMKKPVAERNATPKIYYGALQIEYSRFADVTN